MAESLESNTTGAGKQQQPGVMTMPARKQETLEIMEVHHGGQAGRSALIWSGLQCSALAQPREKEKGRAISGSNGMGMLTKNGDRTGQDRAGPGWIPTWQLDR